MRLTHSWQNDFTASRDGSASHGLGLVEVPTASAGDVSYNHSKLAVEWENLVDEIRRVPNFEHVLRAKRFSQFTPAAQSFLNVDSAEKRVSAVNVPLKQLSHETSKNPSVLRGTCSRYLKTRCKYPNDWNGTQMAKPNLSTLWRDVVKPVIERLGFRVILHNHVHQLSYEGASKCYNAQSGSPKGPLKFN